LTLLSGGIFHAAMGAVLGVAAWTRGNETIQRLKTSAKSLLEDACDLRLNEYRNSHYDVGISASSGGFKATAYCDENLTKIEALKLEFIVAEWTASVNNPF
jgi:hypothetical protein